MFKQCKSLPKVEKKQILNNFQKSSTVTAEQFVSKPNPKDSAILVIVALHKSVSGPSDCENELTKLLPSQIKPSLWFQFWISIDSKKHIHQWVDANRQDISQRSDQLFVGYPSGRIQLQSSNHACPPFSLRSQ